MAAYRLVYDSYVTCRLTAKNRDQLRIPEPYTLGNRIEYGLPFLHWYGTKLLVRENCWYCRWSIFRFSPRWDCVAGTARARRPCPLTLFI